MKNLSPPFPHFNDEKIGAFWFACELIIEMGGGGFCFSFYFVQDCSPVALDFDNLFRWVKTTLLVVRRKQNLL